MRALSFLSIVRRDLPTAPVLRSRFARVGLSAAAALLLVPFAAPAVISGGAAVAAQTLDEVPHFNQTSWSDSDAHDVQVSASGTTTRPDGTTRLNNVVAIGGGNANFGVIHLEGLTEAKGSSFGISDAYVELYDRLLFSNSSATGVAIVNYNVQLDDGFMMNWTPEDPLLPGDPVVAKYSTVITSFLGQGAFSGLSSADIRPRSGGTLDVDKFHQVHLSGLVTLGSFEQLWLSLSALTMAGSEDMSFPGNAVVGYNPAFYWAGISSVTTMAGVPIQFDVMSDSGTDYRQSFAPPIPEPSIWGLISSSLLLLWLWRSRTAVLPS